MLFLLAMAQHTFAIPADPQAKKVRQPDSTYITVMMRGDEHAHITLAADGTPLYYNTRTKAFEYACLKDGRLKGSGILAQDAGRRDAKALAYVASMDKEAMFKTVTDQRKLPQTFGNTRARTDSQGLRRLRINDFPSIGHQKSLVILWEFSDTKFTSVSNPKQFFTGLLNEPGFTWPGTAINGSAHDFYQVSSFGKFDPEFTVYGPVTLSHTASYYGSDDPSQDAKIYEAIIESCKALDGEIDFSEYDTDNDGKVDNIYFFYAGNGQADTPNGNEYIWPHSSYLGAKGWKQDLVLDGKQIDRYTCSNELRYRADGVKVPTGIGTFVHEFGHVLGLTDHYDTSYGMFTFGLGSWDTMASGSYNNDMNTPPVFSAFERAELGWLDYDELTMDADSVNVLPNLADCNKAYRVSVPGTDGREFFVMENRQKKGWDQYIPGHGMLLWHIDIDTTAWNNNVVNVLPAHQRIDIVEADGVTTEASRSSDCFPGVSNVTQWQLKSWAGNDLLKVDHVAEVSDTIRMILANTRFKLPATKNITFSQVQDSSFAATWQLVADATSYAVSAYTLDQTGRRKYLSGLNQKIFPTVDTVLIAGLLPETDYHFDVAAKLAGYTSDTLRAQVQTQELAFAKRIPSGLAATNVTDRGFTARWNEVDGAQDYHVSLYRHQFSKATTDRGYDFSDKYDGLPELWSTSSQNYYSVKGYYGNSAPSLRLSATDDYLMVAYPESKIEQVKCWLRGSKAGNKLHVETADSTDWTEVKVIDVSTAAQTVTVATDGAKKVRLCLERTAGYVVVDDVVATCHTVERTVMAGLDEVTTYGHTDYAFNQLEPGATYSFRIQAVSGEERSYRSPECVITLPQISGIDGPQVYKDNLPSEMYDLSGRRLPTDTAKRGFYIINKGGKRYKSIMK